MDALQQKKALLTKINKTKKTLNELKTLGERISAMR